MFMISHLCTCIANDLLINIAISLNVSWNKNLHDDPLFLSHF